MIFFQSLPEFSLLQLEELKVKEFLAESTYKITQAVIASAKTGHHPDHLRAAGLSNSLLLRQLDRSRTISIAETWKRKHRTEINCEGYHQNAVSAR